MSTTLHASNLPVAFTEEALLAAFERFGSVLSVHLERDTVGVSRRSAFIEMASADSARRASDGLNLARFDGCVVSVHSAMTRQHR